MCPEPGCIIIPYQAYWFDGESDTTLDLRLQKLDSEGDLVWHENGVIVNSLSHNYYSRTKISFFGIIPDGEGGVIVGYVVHIGEGERGYVQRISPDGERLWGEDGVEVPGDNGDYYPLGGILEKPSIRMVTDMAGGCIVAFGAHRGIYTQRVNSDGERVWAEEQAFHDESSIFSVKDAISDRRGGMILSFDKTHPSPNRNVVVFRFDNNGESLWGDEEGVSVFRRLIAGISSMDIYLTQADDSTIFVNWDDRTDNEPHARVQAVNLEGELLWDYPGLRISLNDSRQYNLHGTHSNESGVYVWTDTRESENEEWGYYAQRLGTDQSRMWGDDDVLLFDQPGMTFINIESDLSGGAYVFYWDGSSFLQYINGDGELGEVLSVPSDGLPVLPELLSFNLYPNPANGFVSINLPNQGAQLLSWVRIYDMNGRTVQILNPPISKTQYVMDLSLISSGTYIFEVQSQMGSGRVPLQIIN